MAFGSRWRPAGIHIGNIRATPGIPTDIKWQLPAGWHAGEIQWPVPLKLLEPGDIQIYGYHDEVLLMQQITPTKEPGVWRSETVSQGELARVRENLHSRRRRRGAYLAHRRNKLCREHRTVRTIPKTIAAFARREFLRELGRAIRADCSSCAKSRSGKIFAGGILSLAGGERGRRSPAVAIAQE